MQGTILGSRYRVIEYIAKGGFGKTYLAEDTQLPGKDKCVVKQLYPSVDDPNFIKVARRLFKTEAETLNTLGVHDQIPQLMAYFEEDEKFYLVQQYIEGHTLSKELVAEEPWPETKVVELLQDCLNILDYIHDKGVIHRDVKPDNLIRRISDNKLVLVDFGTVKEVIAEQTQLVPVTVAVGTRGYMPTEQARGKPRTTSDIYALGIIAIQALTGVHPTQLEEDDNGEIIWRDKAQCSLPLQEIVSKMAKYHFKERYQSAQETKTALAVLGGTPQTAVSQINAVQYTPTVQLSEAELAALSAQRQGTVVNPSSLVNDHSVLSAPGNLTTFDSEPPESLVASSQAEKSIAQSNLNPVPTELNSMPKSQKSTKTLVTLGIALVVGAIASGGMYFLNQQTTKSAQNSIEEQANNFKTMLDKQDYQTCYDKAIEMRAQTNTTDAASVMPADKLQEFEAKCGLAQAELEAGDLKYGEALAIAKVLPKNTSINEQIQQQIDSWSEKLLAKATKLYEQEGNLEQAIEVVKQIPQDSSVRSQVIDAKSAWKAESASSEALMTTAEKALSEEKWQYAKQQATKVKKSSPSIYWQEQAKAIISQAEEGISETAPQPIAQPEPETTKVLAPVPEVKPAPNPAPSPTKVSNPAPTVSPSITPTQPKPVVTKPEPKPTVRLKQDLSEPLRDLGNNNKPATNIPQNVSPPNDASMRDL